MTLPLRVLARSAGACVVWKRELSRWSKFARWYRQLWRPAGPMPPYSHVCQIGDPVLRHKALAVPHAELSSARVRQVVRKLKEVVRRYDAVGLSAPQIGVALQIFVVEFTEAHERSYSPETCKLREMSTVPLKVFINPEVKVLDYERVVFPEACESVRGFSADVPRYRTVLVSGVDETGAAVSWEARGWAARIVQHEMDHLHGQLYTDVMVRASLVCGCWHEVNVNAGRLNIPFTPRKGAMRFFLRTAT